MASIPTRKQRKKLRGVASSELADWLPQTDLLILAAPVRATLETLGRLQADSRSRVVVLDICSTKTQVLAAMQQLPENFDPIGGHPMCGREVSGLQHADPELYQNARFVLSPLQRTSPQASVLAQEVVQALGAKALFLDAETHDRWAAHTSHLPYLLAAALSLSLPEQSTPLAGPGIRSTARLAGSSVTMMSDILHTNRENVLQALHGLRLQLDGLEQALREPASGQELIALLEKARHQYTHLIKEKHPDDRS